jgi:hypothetical protein
MDPDLDGQAVRWDHVRTGGGRRLSQFAGCSSSRFGTVKLGGGGGGMPASKQACSRRRRCTMNCDICSNPKKKGRKKERKKEEWISDWSGGSVLDSETYLDKARCYRDIPSVAQVLCTIPMLA